MGHGESFWNDVKKLQTEIGGKMKEVLLAMVFGVALVVGLASVYQDQPRGFEDEADRQQLDNLLNSFGE